jgi:dynein heavy chain
MTKLALKIKQTQNRNCDLLPSLYTQFLSTYKTLLDEKRKFIGANIEKYRNGILKLDDANATVKSMSAESEKSNDKIQAAKHEAEIKEAEINSKKKTIDQKLIELTAARTKINYEKEVATELARQADVELSKAMPALLLANEAVEGLENKYIAEMKAVVVPHPDALNVMQAVMVYLGEDVSWMNIKKVIGKPKFKDDLFNYDKDHIPQKRLNGVQKFTKLDNFN